MSPKNIDEETIEKIIDLYVNTKIPRSKICKICNRSCLDVDTVIDRYNRETGGVYSRRKFLSEETIEKIKKLYNEGLTISEIMKECQVSRGSVRRHTEPMRRGNYKNWKNEKDKLISMREENEPYTEIADALGCSPNAARIVLSRQPKQKYHGHNVAPDNAEKHVLTLSTDEYTIIRKVLESLRRHDNRQVQIYSINTKDKTVKLISENTADLLKKHMEFWQKVYSYRKRNKLPLTVAYKMLGMGHVATLSDYEKGRITLWAIAKKQYKLAVQKAARYFELDASEIE